MRAVLLSLCAALLGTQTVGAQDLWRPAGSGPPARPGEGWAQVGDARAAEGRYAAAAAAYLAAIAAGATQPGLSTRLGDVLMAQGELASAEAAYREAIAAALNAPGITEREAVHLDDPHSRAQETALACAGLAAALDRAGQAGAARQMVREALAADPTAAALEVATLPGSDVRIVPEGEVFYRLGLVRLATGRRTDAVAAFHEFLERAPGSRWAEAAQAHVAELESPAGRAPARRTGSGLRLLAAATVLATGGTPAPLIDAAWRSQAAILDDCLDDAAGLARAGGPLRVAIEIEVDGRGRVTSAQAKLSVPDAEPLARCLEDAVRAGLRLPVSPRARPTRARTELLIGTP
jgi:tetratricopeptide (TPR) repeat protein